MTKSQLQSLNEKLFTIISPRIQSFSFKHFDYQLHYSVNVNQGRRLDYCAAVVR